MIYVTGDTHGDRMRFFDNNMVGESSWGENDTLIICGDFGFIFRNNEGEQAFLDKLAEKPYTICFCDGNHENFSALYLYPQEMWMGGKVHKIRRNIFHLMRGQIFDICGKKFFTMGGAYSIDKYMRTEGVSWWKEELPCSIEYNEAIHNLKKANNEVDYIITHTAPSEIIWRLLKNPDNHDKELTGFLDQVMHEIKFKRWFFGHWHMDWKIDEKFRAIWFDVECID